MYSPSPSSPSPSSSAVTIPIPGKSILKKPPPAQAGLFSSLGLSRFTRFLPGGAGQGRHRGNGKEKEREKEVEAAKVLKRAHFILPELVVVYPISSLAPPSTPSLRDEKRAIEDRERERRRRVVRANSMTSLSGSGSGDTASVRTQSSGGAKDGNGKDGGSEEEWWSMDKVESFYRECCEGCQEVPDKGITAALKNTPPTHPRTVDFSGIQLTPTTAPILADVLSIEWGLRKAVFKECDLDEHTLKPILHALLIPRSLAYLSLASNRRLKGNNAWRVIGAYVGQAHALTFLDLSQNPMDKKAVECVVGALGEYAALVAAQAQHAQQEREKEKAEKASLLSLSDSASFDDNSALSPTQAQVTRFYGANGNAGNGVRYGLGPSSLASSSQSSSASSQSASHPSASASGPNTDRPRGLVSLKLDDCALRAAALETLCRAVRTSSLRNISLRHNKIGPTGAVALALMIRDYPDVLQAAPPGTSASAFSTTSSFSTTSVPASPTVAHHHLDHAPPLPTHSDRGILPPSLSNMNKPPAHAVPREPPPKHPTLTAAQTTYTPYVPKRRGQSANAGAGVGTGSAFVASSVLGGVTARHVPSPAPSIASTTSSLASSDSPTKPGAGLGLGSLNAFNDAAARDREAREKELREKEAKEREAKEREGPSAALLDKVRALDALPRVGALRTLDLRGNDLRTGITYIAQVLKRNRTLKVLNLAENKLDVACLVSLAEALKYNSSLETLDLSRNPCSGPGLEGIQSLRTAFTLNTALKRLFLRSTMLGPSGAIALAEFLPESASLLHLDLTENALGLTGVMALSKGLDANGVIRCLDLDIPPGDEECARLCRDILNACVRNTEEAERRAGGASAGPLTPVTGGGSGTGTPLVSTMMTGPGMMNGNGVPPSESGRGQGKGVWGMIEESELAKRIRLDEEKKIEGDVLVRARASVALLEAMLSPPPPPVSPSTQAPPAPLPSPAEALRQAKVLTHELGTVIQQTEDPARMEALLNVNDELTALIARVPPVGRPTLTLQGLGLKWTPGATVASPAKENGGSVAREIGSPNGIGNGHVIGEEEEELPTTPRLDKGKAKAVPEPEEPEKVLSPTLILADDEDDDDPDRMRFSPVEEGEDDGETVIGESPTNRSRSWVEEEGEVFRKGTVLLGPEEMEGEYAGEDLRKELLEAMVERPPPRPVTDQFGMEIPPQDVPPAQEPPPTSPQPLSPSAEKPPPRPYVSRRSSSASLMSMISPTISSFTPGGGKIPEGQASPRTSSPVPTSPSPLGANVRPYIPRTRSSSYDPTSPSQ
ncbi:hypothetical protein MSAN_00137700 [Mycena sanguinolenta]|uniref:RNI-like protein n=1 Tax=Mycena sanguinolenta TaxID=230812 RepID=A0A8H6ZGW0_9AGAR|nr:hypothetical protein MSAN_00137700 [Mycena sanguinolenta]